MEDYISERRPWTAEEHAKLAAMLEAGSSYIGIAIVLKRTVTACRCAAHKRGISRRRRQDLDASKLLALGISEELVDRIRRTL